jgi:hypothetical protein
MELVQDRVQWQDFVQNSDSNFKGLLLLLLMIFEEIMMMI